MVGNTPLIQIPHPFNHKVSLFAKCEWANPSGSVKDRAAANIIKHALNKGLLENKTLIDATSGNTGIAYAMHAASLGIPVELALPENASPERKLMLKNYGAKLHLTSPFEGTDGAQSFVKQTTENNPHYYYPDQYNNDANWQAHVLGTGPEIWDQSQGTCTVFVAGLGTSGTFCGCSRYLKPKGVTCISVQPNSALHGLEGWKHMPTNLVPGIYDDSLADENISVDTLDAYKFSRAAASYLGLMLSPSAAANLKSAYDIVKTLNHGTVVTIFADNASKYLNEAFWSQDDYLIENPF